MRTYLLKLKHLLEIQEAKPLQQNPIFWLGVILPILIAALISIPIMLEGLVFKFSTDGYQCFLEKFKFPLWFSSSSLILGVMVGRFHGSSQRAATLKATREQNNFSNYLNHRDHFQKYMQNVADEFDIKVDAFKIYGILFSESSPEQVAIKLSSNVSEFVATTFKSEFWSKMQFASTVPPFDAEEVNIYFPRFARALGINAEKLGINDYVSFEKIMINIRKIYRRSMEYGFTRVDQNSNIEYEESGISQLIGEFDLWANEYKFKESWKNNNAPTVSFL